MSDYIDQIPAGDWDIPASVILQHDIRQRTEALAQWSQAQLDAICRRSVLLAENSSIDAARVTTLPSGAGYSELGVMVA